MAPEKRGLSSQFSCEVNVRICGAKGTEVEENGFLADFLHTCTGLGKINCAK